MSLSFHDIHKEIVIWNAVVGYCVPGLPVAWNSWRPHSQLYSRVVVTIQLVTATLMCMGSIWFQEIQTLSHTLSVVITILFTAFSGIMFMVHQNRFVLLIARFDRLAELYAKDKKMEERVRLRQQSNYHFAQGVLTLIACIMNMVVLKFFLPNLIRSFGWFGLDGEKHMNFHFWLPFVNVLTSPLFEMVTLLVWLVTITSSIQSYCVDLLFITLFIQEYTHLQVGRDMLLDLFDSILCTSEQPSSVGCRDDHCIAVDMHIMCDHMNCEFNSKLNEWIGVHQEVMSLGEEMCDLYKQIFTMNLSRIVAVVTLLIFLIKPDGEVTIDFVVENTCGSTTVFGVFLILCAVGDIMDSESCRIAELAARIPSYPCSKQCKTSMLVVMLRAQRSLVVCSYFHWAKVSKETLVHIMKMIISYYLALVSIRERGKK